MSMVEKETEDAFFSSEDSEIVAEYTAMSKLSVAAFVLGLASFFALINPLLLTVPVLAAVVAFAAMYAIKVSENELTGRWLGVAGLTLACLFGSWGATMFYTHERTLFQEAHENAEKWLELVSERRLYEAFELHLDFEDREAPKTNLAAVYEVDHSREKMGSEGHGVGTKSKVAVYQEFWDKAPMDKLVKHAKTGKCTFLHIGARDKYNDLGTVAVDELPLKYQFDYEEEGEKKSIEFTIVMNRFNFIGKYEWSVAGIFPKRPAMR